MQYQIPQFIELEDKIVGPLTLKQAFYIGGAAIASVLLYFTVPLWLWIFTSIFIVGGGLGLALIKVNGQPLSRIALDALNFYWQPQSYVWQPDSPGLVKSIDTMKAAVGQEAYLEKVLSGMALRSAWQYVQTGSRNPDEGSTYRGSTQRYEIFRKITGERQAARRIDYR